MGTKDVNYIEIYKDHDFSKPFGIIYARFPQKTLQN